MSITSAIYDAGFNAANQFYENAAVRLGMTPSAYREGGVDASIYFAVGQCSLEAILVATTQKGVCAIPFGDDPDRMMHDLQDRFPNAELIGGDAAFVAANDKGLAAVLLGDSVSRLRRELVRNFPHAELTEDAGALVETVAKVVSAVNVPGTGHDLPLGLHGSEVEIAVWQALRQMPPGETRSHGQIAKTLPMATTAQGVGAACAANIMAVIVPCHRVKADGSVSGYRWGVPRKRQLLEMERAA